MAAVILINSNFYSNQFGSRPLKKRAVKWGISPREVRSAQFFFYTHVFALIENPQPFVEDALLITSKSFITEKAQAPPDLGHNSGARKRTAFNSRQCRFDREGINFCSDNNRKRRRNLKCIKISLSYTCTRVSHTHYQNYNPSAPLQLTHLTLLLPLIILTTLPCLSKGHARHLISQKEDFRDFNLEI